MRGGGEGDVNTYETSAYENYEDAGESFEDVGVSQPRQSSSIGMMNRQARLIA